MKHACTEVNCLTCELAHALRSMLTAVDYKEPEQFEGHHKAYLQQVAIPRAQAALRRVEV